MHLGTAFQLVDDILDYSGDLAETGKNLGDDLAEGKATLPLIRAMHNGTPEQCAIIRRAILEGGLSDFGPVLAAIRDCGALQYARDKARAESGRATQALSALSDSTHRDSLLELAAFAVDRNY
jgi:octaprenyl-diphosphate synthase